MILDFFFPHFLSITNDVAARPRTRLTRGVLLYIDISIPARGDAETGGQRRAGKRAIVKEKSI